jgi:hypothetical protein
MTERTAEEIAAEIADAVLERLFVNRFGEQATRLVLMQGAIVGAERDLGGWSKNAARSQLLPIVRAALAPERGEEKAGE